MWERATELLERADKAQRRFFTLQTKSRRACWEPPVDIFESESELVIIVALPGVREADVEVALDRRDLLITAHRSLPGVLAAGAVQRLEIPQGRFERRMPLAAGQLRDDGARFQGRLLVATAAQGFLMASIAEPNLSTRTFFRDVRAAESPKRCASRPQRCERDARERHAGS